MLYIGLIGIATEINAVIIIMAILILPSLLILVWNKGKRKKLLKCWLIYSALVALAWGTNYGILEYRESLRIKTDININIYDYMPFEEESKIVKLEKEASLKLKENLPRLDGAAAVFPLYSAIVNAVYPESTEYNYEEGSVFSYHNTVEGYKLLAEKEIDIFFGAYPSKEQLEYANDQGTEFEFIEIGKEGFVFFVNKDNPVESLTSSQIRDIYSGKITNWKEVGGKDEKMIACNGHKLNT
jgi:phosphate transport system substrate-binding protein